MRRDPLRRRYTHIPQGGPAQRNITMRKYIPTHRWQWIRFLLTQRSAAIEHHHEMHSTRDRLTRGYRSNAALDKVVGCEDSPPELLLTKEALRSIAGDLAGYQLSSSSSSDSEDVESNIPELLL